MTDAELEAERKLAHEKSIKLNGDKVESQQSENHPLLVFVAWTLVAIPIGYGIYSTLQKAWILFN